MPGAAASAAAAEAVARRLAAVEERIAAACARGGRRRADVTLLGVSKTQPAEAVAAAWAAGLRTFGENRVQEATAKAPALPPGIEWHLIGPLQSNKVRPALGLFHAIHSIDREKIALAVDREAVARGLRIPGFLEVNLGAEPSKHGFLPEGLAGAARPLADLAGLSIVGLMAVPPEGELAEDSRPWFRRLRELRDELGSRPGWSGFPGWLSMGMSHDFEVAIEEGATHVRVGTAIFGPRQSAAAPPPRE